MTRHIHADLMIQAANDTTIQWDWKAEQADICDWQACVGKPAFCEDSQYRQRPTPHPHQDLMDQAKADPSIRWQFQNSIGLGLWLDCKPNHEWFPTCKYRQKPAEPVMVDLWQWSFRSRVTGGIFASNEYHANKPVDSLFQSSSPVCRIEGSKISVPEVSQ